MSLPAALDTNLARRGGGCVSNAAGGISPYSSSCNLLQIRDRLSSDVIRCIDKMKSNRKQEDILMACCTQEERFEFMRGG